MTRKRTSGIAAVALVIGVLIGASGTIVLRDATVTDADQAAAMADHMNGQGMAGMMSMSGSTAGMMSMMSGSMMGGSTGLHGPRDHGSERFGDARRHARWAPRLADAGGFAVT